MWFLKEKIQFGCNLCGECCRNMDVPLTHYDIARLLQAETAPDLETLVTLHPSLGDELDAVKLYGEYNTLYLSNKLSDNSCIFLENNACTIYNHRPNSCRTWPFSKDSRDRLKIDAVAGQTVADFCDKTRFKEHTRTLKTINQGIEEVFEFRNLLKIWNNGVDDYPEKQNLETFLQFALEYSRRVKAGIVPVFGQIIN
jgi:Fe-S-cluster containining protein